MFNRTRKGVPCVLMFLLILIAFGCAEKNRQANLTDDLARTFDDYFQTLTRNGEFSGSVLVVKNGHIRLHRGYGFADRELKTLNDPRTKFRIGSITKCFTAVLAMKLVEEGRLSLEGKINDYLPDYRNDTGSKITVYHLLTHTSGLPPGFSLPELDPRHAHDLSVMAEYAVRHCNENLDSPPGEQWAYSNQGYYLLGAIIEKATGRTYEDNLKELIFAPLDMKDSGYDSENPPGGRFARGYYSDEGTLIPVGFADTYSAGAIYSTTEDLMKLDRALSSDRILSEASRETLFKPYKGYYGCGWFTTEYEGHLCHSHAGRIGGFPVNIARYPEDGACIIVLSNLDSTPLNDVARNAEAMLFDRDGRLPGRRRSYTPSPESLERWAGTYDLQGLTFKVSAERSGLIVIMQGLPEIRTVPLSENEFGIPAMDAVLSFRENDAGHGVSLFLNMGSVNMLGVRKQGGAGLE